MTILAKSIAIRLLVELEPCPIFIKQPDLSFVPLLLQALFNYWWRNEIIKSFQVKKEFFTFEHHE
jgi:hypothetical protein